MRKIITSVILTIGTEPGQYPPGGFISNPLFAYGNPISILVSNIPALRDYGFTHTPGNSFILVDGGLSEGATVVINFENAIEINF